MFSERAIFNNARNVAKNENKYVSLQHRARARTYNNDRTTTQKRHCRQNRRLRNPAHSQRRLCYVLFTSIDFSEMADIVRRECRPQWIAATLALSILSHVVRAARWRIQLNALGLKCSLWELTLSIFGTYAVNLVFPRLGEIWRTTFVARRRHAPFAQVFGSMVADRLSDTITVLIITACTFALASGHMLEYLKGSAGTLGRIGALLSSPWLWAAGIACAAGHGFS